MDIEIEDLNNQDQKRHLLFAFFTDLMEKEGEKLKYGIQELCDIFDELYSLDYIITHLIGCGGEGPVFAVVKDQQQFAVKCIIVMNKQAIERQEKVFRLMKNKPYIHQFINGLYSKNNKYYFQITEKLDYDLEFLITKNAFELDSIIALAYQMTKALQVLKENNSYHLDIKPQNILYDMDNGCFKLADYGISKIRKYLDTTNDTSAIGVNHKYISPEAFKEALQQNTMTDIYSLGLIFLELTLDRLLTREEVRQIRENQNNLLNFLNKKNEFNQFNQIISKMLIQESQQRMSLKDILQNLTSIQTIKEKIIFSNKIYRDFSRVTQTQIYSKKNYQIRLIQQHFLKLLKRENLFQQTYLQKYFKKSESLFLDLNECGVIIKYWDDNKIYFSLLGLENCLYEDFIIHFCFEIRDQYPWKPPKCIIQSQILHPYVEQQENDLITNIDLFFTQWTPALSVIMSSKSLQSALNQNTYIYEKECNFNLEQNIVMINEAKKKLLTLQQFFDKLENDENYCEKVKNQAD
ncbi:hypothetical protein ABPG72_012413 [Tetrahymena utriculariae]